jgi:hypothetical protein
MHILKFYLIFVSLWVCLNYFSNVLCLFHGSQATELPVCGPEFILMSLHFHPQQSYLRAKWWHILSWQHLMLMKLHGNHHYSYAFHSLVSHCTWPTSATSILCSDRHSCGYQNASGIRVEMVNLVQTVWVSVRLYFPQLRTHLRGIFLSLRL